jgi:rhodanese-related sulfurtransferase
MKYNFDKIVNSSKSILNIFTFLLLLASVTYAQNDSSASSNTLPPNAVKPTDPWIASDIITVQDLLNVINGKKKDKPTIIQIGFKSLYEYAHIPGSIFAGPAENDDGIELLKLKTNKMSKSQNIVLYCGCCMWYECPNIRKAYREMKDLGFRNVKALYIPNSFNADWKNKGYPVEKGETN